MPATRVLPPHPTDANGRHDDRYYTKEQVDTSVDAVAALASGIRVLGEFDTEEELPGSGTAGDAYLVGAETPRDLYIWAGDEWTNQGPISGQGSVSLENALGAAVGLILADGQITAGVYGADGLPIPAANELLVESFTRDGITLGSGAVDSVNGQTGAVVLDAADVGALPDTTDVASASYEGAHITLGSPDDWAEDVGARTATTWDTYDGSGVIVHPSVCYFPRAFNGYHWWAATTPYPSGNDDYENPSIFVSLDGTDWIEPPGVTNPLVPFPGGSMFNADPHLYQGPDHRLYLTYGTFVSSGVTPNSVIISEDGVTWSSPVVIHPNNSTNRLGAPTIWYDAAEAEWVALGTYRQTSNSFTVGDAFLRSTAPEIDGPWSTPTVVTISPALSLHPVPWHHHSLQVGDEIWALLLDLAHTSPYDNGQNYLAVSRDGGHTFERSTAPIGDSTSYKASLLLAHTPTGMQFDAWIGGQGSTWGATRTRIVQAPIMVSPNGTAYRLAVANDGTLSTVAV